MAIDASVALTNTNAVAFPGTESVNASGPTAVDGTEYVKVLIDNYMMGPQQALLNFAGLTPDGLPEEDGASQELEAMQKSFGYPGEAVNWYGDLDPATVGARILLLHGQGILISQYTELTTSVYVGDGNNATAPAFYKADDAAGTIRNIAGIYLILPDAQETYPQFKPESVYSARIDAAGTILSQSSPWISTAVWTASKLLITYNTGFFGGVPPSILSTVVFDSTTQNNIVGTDLETASSVTLTVSQPGVGSSSRPLSVAVQRQDADYSPFGDDFIELGIRY